MSGIPINGQVIPEDEIIDPRDQLIKEIDELREATISGDVVGVVVEDIDEETICAFNDCEVQFFLAGVRSASIAAEIFEAYVGAPDSGYSTWSAYWETQKDRVGDIADTFQSAADSIPDDPDYAAHKEYLLALAQDWREGRGRSTADSELMWYFLPRNICRVDLRGLPKIEEGSQAYIHPGRQDGGNTSLTVRIVEPRQNPAEFQMIEGAIPDFLAAENVWNSYKLIDFEMHRLVLRAALHGFTRATGHQYKRRVNESGTLVRIISNWNIKALSKQEFLHKMDGSFSPEILGEMRAVVSSDSIAALYGHEMSEVLIEDIYEAQINKLGRREAVELLATIGTIEAARQQIKDPSDGYSKMYEFLMRDFVAACVRLDSLPWDKKLGVYLRGYHAAMKRLVAANAVVYDDEHRISAINRPEFELTISGLAQEVFDIIKNGDREAHDKLFDIETSP